MLAKKSTSFYCFNTPASIHYSPPELSKNKVNLWTTFWEMSESNNWILFFLCLVAFPGLIVTVGAYFAVSGAYYFFKGKTHDEIMDLFVATDDNEL